MTLFQWSGCKIALNSAEARSKHQSTDLSQYFKTVFTSQKLFSVAYIHYNFDGRNGQNKFLFLSFRCQLQHYPNYNKYSNGKLTCYQQLPANLQSWERDYIVTSFYRLLTWVSQPFGSIAAKQASVCQPLKTEFLIWIFFSWVVEFTDLSTYCRKSVCNLGFRSSKMQWELKSTQLRRIQGSKYIYGFVVTHLNKNLIQGGCWDPCHCYEIL